MKKLFVMTGVLACSVVFCANTETTTAQLEESVKPGMIYTVSCKIRTELQKGSCGISLQFSEKKSSLTSQVIKYHPLDPSFNDKGWQQISYTFKVPDDRNCITVQVSGDNINGKFYADGLKLNEGTVIPQVPAVAQVGENAWSNALCFNDFIQVGDMQTDSQDKLKNVKPAIPPSELKMLFHDGTLYLRVTCMEPEMENRKIDAVERDSTPYNDDGIQIFIDGVRDRQNFYQIAINSQGAYYDAFGSDKKWNPASLKVNVFQKADRWIADVSISFLDLGYGEMEYRMQNKKIGFVLFRDRTLKGKEPERSTFLQWGWPVYRDPMRYWPIDVGVSGIQGATYSFMARGVDNPRNIRPRQSWKTEQPLYEELMSDILLHMDKQLPIGSCCLGRMISGNQNWNSSAFALRSGMKYHYSEIIDLLKKMRVADEMPEGFSEGSFAWEMRKKYNPMICWYLMPHGNNSYKALCPGIPGTRPGFKYYFIGDDRVAKTFCDALEDGFKKRYQNVVMVPLGHETHSKFFDNFDLFRTAYLKEDPEAWAGFENEAKGRYGFGKYGFPKSIDSATPYERIVFHKWFLEKYNNCMKEAAARLRKIKPEIIITSDIEVGGVAPALYESAVGTYNYITAQQMPSGSANRQKIGFSTKLMGDLAETPVQTGAHVEHYFFSLNAEELNEILSEAFRVGGKSLALWLVDWYGKTYSDYYGSPERFYEIKHIFKEIGKMRKLKFPKADSAILFSNITKFAENWWLHRSLDRDAIEYESIFTVLGPHAGSWFRFVSDYQISKGNHDLKQYKVIYVPSARYQDSETVVRLEEYVKNGGILVFGSPDLLEKSDDGTTRTELKKEWMGIEVIGETSIAGSMTYKDMLIPGFGSPGFILKTVGNARVLATFADGSPAIVEKLFGKGKVFTFASNPFNNNLFTNTKAAELFHTIQQEFHCQTEQPIWRFRFPRPKKTMPPLWNDNMVCVTGNACAWELESIVDGPNAPLKFKAAYSLAPDLIPDKSANCGNLFNRKAALDLPQLKRNKTLPSLQGWASAWKTKEAFSITLDFPKQLQNGEIKLWCHGDIPSIELYAKSGNKYVLVGKAEISHTAESVDVREITIPFRGDFSDFELRFDLRSKGDFYLGELEVWTQK